MLPDARFLESTLCEPLGLELRMSIASGHACRDPLSDSERRHYQSLQGTARETSWLLGRAALKRLRAEVDGGAGVDELEFPNARYSLTHSTDLALAVADLGGRLKGIGVDLEVDTRIQPEAARFFLTDREQRWLDGQTAERWPHHLLRLWCVKEAVFKANSENAGTTLGDHELAEPAEPFGEARARGGQRMEYASWCESRTCVALAVCR